MTIVWTSGKLLAGTGDECVFQGQYQEVLRSVGAWLDARGYNLSRISASGDSFVIEVQSGTPGDDPVHEVLRLDVEALSRLADAARNDRNRFSSPA